MRVVTIIGARPQFIKHAPMSVELEKRHHEDIIIHTGQHYDISMSDRFFEELNIPEPAYNLEVGSNTHAKQTADIMSGVEDILINENPDIVFVYGDTNSTMGGAISASKLHIPIAHIEAGLRSYDKTMPEEINRIVTDHISNYLFCPTVSAFDNLHHEGVSYDTVFLVGDIMVDTYSMFNKRAERYKHLIHRIVGDNEYYIATIHRASNTDNCDNLATIIESLEESGKTIILPLHPRTHKLMEKYGLFHIGSNILYTEPFSYLEMLCFMKYATKIITDSGGVQKEAYIMGVPCVTVRDTTEWIETLIDGRNILVGTNKNTIVSAINSKQYSYHYKNYFGDGNTSQKILDILEEDFK